MTLNKAPQVTVLDYGIGNLLNVVRALEHCGATVRVATQASELGELGELDRCFAHPALTLS